MPDFEICVKAKDKMYCLDTKTGKVTELTVRDIPITECPANIATALVRRLMNRQGMNNTHE